MVTWVDILSENVLIEKRKSETLETQSFRWRYDTQDKDIQHNNTQHNMQRKHPA
jgi:hypothetical protein